MIRAATDKQISFIERLVVERHWSDDQQVREEAESRLALVIKNHRDQVEIKDTTWASVCITWLLARPKKQAVAVDEPITPGVYQKNGDVFVVKPNKAGNNLYAKKLIPFEGERLTLDGETVKFEFVYAPGAVKSLVSQDKMPLEDAEKLMLEYGRCICCNRQLKNADSVRAGIGPICRGKFA